MPKTIKGKAMVIYVCFVTLIASFGVCSLLMIDTIGFSVDRLIHSKYSTISNLDKMDSALTTQNLVLAEYLSSSKKLSPAERFQFQATLFMNLYNAEYEKASGADEVNMIYSIFSNYNEFLDMFPQIMSYDKSNPEEFAYANQYYEEELIIKIGKIRGAIQDYSLYSEEIMYEQKTNASDSISRAINILFILFILAIIAGYYLPKTYGRIVLMPVFGILKRAKFKHPDELISSGRKKGSRDELVTLCNEYNYMAQKLNEYEASTLGMLMEESNKTYAIVRSISEPMVILDSNYHIILLNQSFEKLFNTTVDTAIGKHFLEIISNSGLKREADKLDYQSSEYTEAVISLIQNQVELFYNVTITPLSYTGEGKNAVIIVFYNISSLKTLEKLKSDFISTISHEFKTPLTSIVMATDLLSSTSIGKLNPDQLEIIEALREDSSRLINLVNDLLELSKIESSETVYNFTVCDLEAIIRKSMQQFYSLAEKIGVALTFEPVLPLPMVMADSAKIIWVMNNLLSNALKYTDDNDIIAVKAELFENQYIMVSVNDSGIGIPPEYKEKIFEKYFQVPGSDVELRGTGLGLAVSKDIVIAHGGQIWCESDLNSGSTFFFTIPTSK